MMNLPTINVQRHPPMSNAERQCQFRARNPDYTRLYKAKRRAELAAYSAAKAAAKTQALPAPVTMIVPHKQLALPAPVIPLMVFPGINAPAVVDERERVSRAA